MLFLSAFLLMASYDPNLFQATGAERGLTSEYTRAHTAALQNFAAPRETPSERGCPVGTKVHLPADGN